MLGGKRPWTLVSSGHLSYKQFTLAGTWCPDRPVVVSLVRLGGLKSPQPFPQIMMETFGGGLVLSFCHRLNDCDSTSDSRWSISHAAETSLNLSHCHLGRGEAQECSSTTGHLPEHMPKFLLFWERPTLAQCVSKAACSS